MVTEATMTSTRYLVSAGLAALGLALFCLLLAVTLDDADRINARAPGESQDLDRKAYTAQLLAMRDLHELALTATTPQTRESIVRESGPVMHAGVSMMLRMKSALPTSVPATGVVTSENITEPEAKLVTDFLQLMELLVQMKSDNEAAAHPWTHPGTHPGTRPDAHESDELTAPEHWRRHDKAPAPASRLVLLFEFDTDTGSGAGQPGFMA